MTTMLEAWKPNATYHHWVMPDGHHVQCNVTEVKSHNIPMGDSGLTFGYRAEVPVVKRKGISLPANIVHSVDAYIVREMVRKADKQGFELLTIHDSFWARPKYMNEVRANYLDILMSIAQMDLLQDILRDIAGNKMLTVRKISKDLHLSMVDAEYALS